MKRASASCGATPTERAVACHTADSAGRSSAGTTMKPIRSPENSVLLNEPQ